MHRSPATVFLWNVTCTLSVQGPSADPVPMDGPNGSSNQPHVHSTGVFAGMDSDDDLELVEELTLTQALEVSEHSAAALV